MILMDNDYIILAVVILLGFLVNLGLSYGIGVDVFPIFQPDFCDESASRFWCLKVWGILEIAAITIVLYFVVAHKPDERIKG